MASSLPDNWKEGCKHYKRYCKLIAPCCENTYSCRFCHDDDQNHKLNRKEVVTVLCSDCFTIQPVAKFCRKCHICFGNYTCLKCNLFDNELKGQFHCEECGICRVGGQNNYFHCKKCNFCFSLQLLGNHKCIENVSRTNCPICLEDIHNSRSTVHVPPCNHLLHTTCYDDLKKTGRNKCSICEQQY